jgi:hypothetical protein
MCQHIEAARKNPKPRPKPGTKAHVCAECILIPGATWVHLRTCQTDGVTRCCDSSPNRHASKHARASKHPVVQSAEPGEDWFYCYPDEQFEE